MRIHLRLLIVFAAVAASALLARTASAQPCGSQEIVLRDSIGPTSASTDGNFAWQSWGFETFDAPWFLIPITVAAPQNLRLRSWRAIGAQTECVDWPDCVDHFSACDYRLMVWTDWSAFSGSPRSGNVANVTFGTPSIGPSVYGQTGVNPADGETHDTYDMTFDVAAADIQIPAGQSRVIAVQVRNLLNQYPEIYFGWVESNEANSNSDSVCWDGGPCEPISQLMGHHYGGRVAVKITGEIIGPMPGDVNGDGVIGTADVSPFVAVLLDPAGATPAQRCAADIDQSGVVDGTDIQPFVNALLHP